MASQEKARKVYHFLREHYDSGTAFTIKDLMEVTEWKESTVRTYITKQWREVMNRKEDGSIVVRPEIRRLSEDAFLQLATQRREIFSDYQRFKFHEVVMYEFLLPLTREDQLRKALDDLFYEDTIRHRLSEIKMERIMHWIPREKNESEAAYIGRVCHIVSDMFGGYSISHVSGRYRAASLTSRQDAARMLVNDERYIIDETSASVRFIIPVQSTKVSEIEKFDEIDIEQHNLEQDVRDEIRLIHLLFFHLFVEAVVRMVKEEDEIWLVEEAGRSRSLYVWERD